MIYLSLLMQFSANCQHMLAKLSFLISSFLISSPSTNGISFYFYSIVCKIMMYATLLIIYLSQLDSEKYMLM